MKYTSLVAICVVAVACTIQTASAAVIYSDTFSRTTGSGDGNGNPAGTGNGASDWGSADNGAGGTATAAWSAGRNGGLTGGAQFTTNGTRAHLFSGAAHTTFNAATSAPAGFTVAFDFSRIDTGVVAAPSNGLLAVGTGYDETVNEFSPFEVSGNSQFAVLFQQANNGNAANGEIFVDGTSQGTFDYLDPVAEHSVLLSFIPTTAGAYGATDDIAASVTVNGASVFSGTVQGGADFGDLGFATNLFTAPYIDNLVVTAVPEPGSAIALASLASVGLLRRKRKS
ncbi:hypothetical protein LF1_04010 [Rubripirellula obstinata]|uniref:Ice-binding protein C-terminal domain-containing protein n=1 Tax=Rubripirellula obstinata TaxID=406547 RepID=A0A5B1CCE6_9BACT|nr:PEP-CTERM sorting domain-containing protein [Rubripirellula obstinata]KAA1257911.1 hypothetical protein LF1_04010 [Rubripirellula obstinata]